jgi:hypothetical protein
MIFGVCASCIHFFLGARLAKKASWVSGESLKDEGALLEIGGPQLGQLQYLGEIQLRPCMMGSSQICTVHV